MAGRGGFGRGGNGRGNNGKRGRSNNLAPGMRPVSENDRISLMERLQEFRESNAQEMTFEAGLSNHDRAVVHTFCKKLGFKSKSYGVGDDRRLTVSKSTVRPKGPAPPKPICFSHEAHQTMQELFTRFPPSDEEATLTDGFDKAVVDSPPSSSTDKASCLSMPPSTISELIAELDKRKRSNSSLRQISETTSKLPIAAFRKKITSTVEKNQVVIIAGETGCGKSTQVPQFLLDHMWGQKKPCRIFCTQPRRISATSVADRVATERGEPIGESVGYQIRLESKGGPHSSLMFCTNGVLLRKLVASKNTSGPRSAIDATHIIVDEIHERDCNADFLLIILKDLLTSEPNLRLVLMSATLDAELFSAYFNGCPVLKIPGFTHPVRVYHLEDALMLLRGSGSKDRREDVEEASSLEPDPEIENGLTYAWLDDDFEPLINLLTENPSPEVFNYQHSATGATPLMVAAGKGRLDDISLLLSLGADCSLKSLDRETALDWAEKYGQDEAATLLRDHAAEQVSQSAAKEAELLGEYHKTADQDEVDTILIERLLRKICEFPDDGAVLVFLPGWEDITRCRERLAMSPVFSDSTKYLLLSLHSMVPMNEQKRIFQSPPSGVRKIVMATNIAETSITIDDVVYVIDSGRMKEKSYDPFANVSTFQTVWISKASARQRQGRAGRCRPGICYRVFSKARAASMAEFQVPEMKRTPLEELCLKVKLLEPDGNIRHFLSKALDPPLDIAIQNAVRLLQDIGALNPSEELTELGKQLGSLPVHPSTSKMLLLAILLNCLDPALTIACASGYRDPFILPMAPGEKRQAFAAKQQLASIYGGYSDHLAVVAAFEGWAAAKKRGQEARFCNQNFLSPGVMFMLDGMRKQLLGELVQKGFVPRDTKTCSLNSQHPGIVRAVVLASMYPMVGRLLPPLRDGQKAVVQTPRGEKVRIHGQSANFKLVHSRAGSTDIYNQHLVVFDEITRGEGQVTIRNSTLVKPHLLLFICHELAVAPLEYHSDSEEDDEAADKGDVLMAAPESTIAMVIDRWLQYQSTSVEAAQIYCLRERLRAALFFKIRNPRADLPEMLAASVFAVACILSLEGGVAIDPPPSTSRSFSNSNNNTYSRDTRPWPKRGGGKQQQLQQQQRSFQNDARYNSTTTQQVQQRFRNSSAEVRYNNSTSFQYQQNRSSSSELRTNSTQTQLRYVPKNRSSS